MSDLTTVERRRLEILDAWLAEAVDSNNYCILADEASELWNTLHEQELLSETAPAATDAAPGLMFFVSPQLARLLIDVHQLQIDISNIHQYLERRRSKLHSEITDTTLLNLFSSLKDLKVKLAEQVILDLTAMGIPAREQLKIIAAPRMTLE